MNFNFLKWFFINYLPFLLNSFNVSLSFGKSMHIWFSKHLLSWHKPGHKESLWKQRSEIKYFFCIQKWVPIRRRWILLCAFWKQNYFWWTWFYLKQPIKSKGVFSKWWNTSNHDLIIITTVWFLTNLEVIQKISLINDHCFLFFVTIYHFEM